MRAQSALVLIAIGLSDCSPGPSKPVPARQPRSRAFRLDLEASKIAARKLRITVTTNLPDGALLHVSVGRDYDETITDSTLPKLDQTAVGEIFAEDLPVQRGKVEAIVEVDDRIWMREREAKKEKVKNIGMFLGPVRNIRPEVEVSTLFTPSNPQQPTEVLKVTGNQGELIENAQGSGRPRILRQIRKVVVPVNAK